MRKILLLIIVFTCFIKSTYASTSDTLVKKNTNLRNAKKHFDNLDAKIALKQAFNSKGKFKSFKSFTKNYKKRFFKNQNNCLQSKTLI